MSGEGWGRKSEISEVLGGNDKRWGQYQHPGVDFFAGMRGVGRRRREYRHLQSRFSGEVLSPDPGR